nr:MFS transporter [Brevibacterium luteolum]
MTGAVPKRGFVFALAATIATMLAASAPSLFYPDLAESLDLTPVATTLVFAVYAFTLLVTLLYLGPVSDRLGRRPVITIGSALLAASIVMFWHAGSLTALLVARGLQGVGAGIVIPALSAMLIDFEAPTRPGSASLWNTIGPMLGLGTGALGAAILLDITADPAVAVFGGLSAVFLLLTVLIWTTPELVSRTRVRWAELRPRFMVPVHLRPLFAASMPAIIAGWATNGLFLALGAGLVRAELGGTTYTHAGVVIFTLAASGITASVLLYRCSPRTISLYSTSALALGTGLSIGALSVHSYPAYLATVAIVGSGFGTAFLGVLRTLLPLTGSTERAAVMSVIYTVSYLAFGVPTIIVGLLVPLITLQGAMIVLGIAVIILAALSTVARARLKPQEQPDEDRTFGR